MNHLFSSYNGVFMFAYLDDIIIFSGAIGERVKHVKIVFEILRKERLFLSPNKMQFFAEELKVLGHVIDVKGVQMGSHKVDKVVNWKTPDEQGFTLKFHRSSGIPSTRF